MEKIPRAGEFYRHFKNKLYQVIAIAKNSETGEDLVIYQALYGDFGIYARPLAMFMSKVDKEKYPDVAQNDRFEHVMPPFDEKAVHTSVQTTATEEALRTENETVTEIGTTPENRTETETVSDKLMEFFDADTLEEKYNVLVSMSDTITDQMIDSMAVVLDVVIPEGELFKRYDALKQSIRTRQKYEYANRLR